MRYGHQNTNDWLSDQVNPMGRGIDTSPGALQPFSLTDKECEMVNYEDDILQNYEKTHIYSATGFNSETTGGKHRFFEMNIEYSCWERKPIWWNDFGCYNQGAHC